MGDAGTGIAQRPCAGAEPGASFAQRLRHCRERHVESLASPIRLRDNNLQIATDVGRVEIIYDERSRRDANFMDNDAVLMDADHRVAFGDAAHCGRVAAQRVGQHAFIGMETHPGKGDAVKQLASGVALSHPQLAVQGR